MQHGCRARSESIVTQVFMEASFPHGPLTPPQPQLNTTSAIGFPVPVQHLLGQPAEVGKMRAGRFRSAPRALTPPSLSSRLPENRGRITFKSASHGVPCVPGTKLRPSGPAIFFTGCAPRMPLGHRSTLDADLRGPEHLNKICHMTRRVIGGRTNTSENSQHHLPNSG